ncbi:hypothetical protein C5613_39305 [Rhodococcus opacus]|uniref:Transposase n=1 Tax=Rhodococcus opacus TaxID=37919 RepID=A0A2S8IJU2_RHOOP|nr:hypothetical protein C5613_39305 [Rhodococcus opacus]
MIDMPKPYPEEFRGDVVAVACNREAPLEQVAKDSGISETCLKNGLRMDGTRPGPTRACSVTRTRSGTPSSASSPSTRACGPLPRGLGVRCALRRFQLPTRGAFRRSMRSAPLATERVRRRRQRHCGRRSWRWGDRMTV